MNMQVELGACSSTVECFKSVENAAFEFVAMLDQLERSMRKSAISVPSISSRMQVATDYWRLFGVVEAFQSKHMNKNLDEYKARLRTIILPWLSRSRFFWRCHAKPHGYAGDFKIIDWMYDLEFSAGEDPTEPALVNCLDYTFSTNDSVVSLWDRRRWIKQLLLVEARRNPSLRVLDVACGGARYLKDFMDECDAPENVSLTLMDQDPAALAFAKNVNLKRYEGQVSTVCAPVMHIHQYISEDYDVIISSGLFDYLDQALSESMLQFFASRLNAHGLIAITNYHTNDRSAVSKDWCVDWPLIFKDETQVERMFPSPANPDIQVSPNGSLIMASWRKP